MSEYAFAGWTVLIAFILCFLSARIAIHHPAITFFVHKLWILIVRVTDEDKYKLPAMDSRANQLHDIYHIAFLLRKTKLDNDVVPAILEYAELWETATTHARFAPHGRISEERAPHQLLVCEIGRSRVAKPVRKVTFKITAHDQGFADDRDGGSWTWFTAQKTPANDSRSQSEDDEDSTSLPADHCREIVRNPIADGRWTAHEVTWRADSEDLAEAEWVGSLMASDRIFIHAWARFPGWHNYVRDVAVEVYSVAVT